MELLLQCFASLFFPQKGEEDGEDDESEGNDMIPADGFAFEHCGYDDGEDSQRDGFLYDF